MSRRVTVQTKSFWQSRIFWTQIAVILIAVLSAPEVVAIIPLDKLPVIAAVSAVITIALRYFTVSPIGIGADKAAKRT